VSVKTFDLRTNDTFISPYAFLYGEDSLPVEIDSTTHDAYFSMILETELAVEASAFNYATTKTFIDSTTYYYKSSLDKTIYLNDNISNIVSVGCLLLIDNELMRINGFGSWISTDYGKLPVYVTRAWNDSTVEYSVTPEYTYHKTVTTFEDGDFNNLDPENLTVVESNVVLNEEADSTAYIGDQFIEYSLTKYEERVVFEDRYTDAIRHNKGSLVRIFILKDVEAIIDLGGRIYYDWGDVYTIAPPGKYIGEFKLVNRNNGEIIILPNSESSGEWRTIVINVRS
jgi:hypothetical protein